MHLLANFWVYGMGTFPFRYLGISMHLRRLKNADWKEVEEWFQKKLCACKGKMLSVRGRLVLINSILSNLSMYMLSFFKVHREVLKKNYIFTGLDSSSNINIKRSIDLVNVAYSVPRKTKGA